MLAQVLRLLRPDLLTTVTEQSQMSLQSHQYTTCSQTPKTIVTWINSASASKTTWNHLLKSLDHHAHLPTLAPLPHILRKKSLDSPNYISCRLLMFCLPYSSIMKTPFFPWWPRRTISCTPHRRIVNSSVSPHLVGEFRSRDACEQIVD